MVVSLSTIGMFGTGALLTDQVSMAAVAVEGGTLDIRANAQQGPGATYAAFSATLTGMRPGDTSWSDVVVSNNGSLPANLTVSVTGADTHPDYPAENCFSYYFREVGATGSTNNGATVGSPTNLAAMGTAETPDASTVLFDTAVANRTLTDVSGVDNAWESGDTKTYRLTVRMRSECRQGGEGTAAATGALNVSFDAVPA